MKTILIGWNFCWTHNWSLRSSRAYFSLETERKHISSKNLFIPKKVIHTHTHTHTRTHTYKYTHTNSRACATRTTTTTTTTTIEAMNQKEQDVCVKVKVKRTHLYLQNNRSIFVLVTNTTQRNPLEGLVLSFKLHTRLFEKTWRNVWKCFWINYSYHKV